jgi:uncharacterized protein with PQ loop repeat
MLFMRSGSMTTVHPGGPVVAFSKDLPSARHLAQIMRFFSVITMLMTVPQVVTVWKGPVVRGVSLPTWLTYLLSAFLWLVYGIRKRDKTIYLACIGWILLDAAVVIGVFLHR